VQWRRSRHGRLTGFSSTNEIRSSLQS